MLNKTKAETLIGFAVKAGKVVYGADNIEKSKRIRLIVYDKDISENTQKRLDLAAKTYKIRVLVAQKPLEEIVFKKNVKAIALTDLQMSNAMLKDVAGFSEKDIH